MTASPILNAWLQENQLAGDSPDSDPALIVAARQGRADILAGLLEQGGDVNVIDQYGNNAVWAACYAESEACLTLLRQAGAALDYQNPNGGTALMYAASAGKNRIVEYLLQAGANPHLANADDFTALDLAANRQCLQLLRHL